MLQELKGKKVTIYLNYSGFGDSCEVGEVIDSNDSWLKLNSKKSMTLIATSAIKTIKVKSK
jgi:hypothetical protein